MRRAEHVVWREGPGFLAPLIMSITAAVTMCWSGLVLMGHYWFTRDEYSHGVLIPLISLYLVWQRLPELSKIQFTGSWVGAIIALAGVLVYAMGELSSLYVIVQYSFLIILYGVVLSLMGWRAFRVVLIPLLIMAFMIPLPNFLYNNLSSKLQLLSSELGVAVIRLFGISVFLEGNVIDLGTFKLQVVEACNGLRYLFPLMTLGFVVAYLYQAAFWKRAVIFLSTMPITVLMNSFRIGVIGVMVDRWGQEMAEGFLHDFEGWIIFMACFGVLFVEMWLLMRLTGDRRPLREVFGLEMPARPSVSPNSIRLRAVPKPLLTTALILVVAVIATHALPARQELEPARADFADFPTEIAAWRGQTEQMEQIYIDALKFTDYAMINYRDDRNNVVNFYSAYYASQRKGQSVHSPRSCLPGGGWRIESLSQRDVTGATISGIPLRVNRALISYGDQKQLVYYWFQQRGRVITNEYMVKWLMFWDAITKNRTDGALVRLVLPLNTNEDQEQADKTMSDFARALSPVLPAFIPN